MQISDLDLGVPTARISLPNDVESSLQHLQARKDRRKQKRMKKSGDTPPQPSPSGMATTPTLPEQKHLADSGIKVTGQDQSLTCVLFPDGI